MTLIEFHRENIWQRLWVQAGLERATIAAMAAKGYETTYLAQDKSKAED